MKKLYEIPEVMILEFTQEDIITTSPGGNELEDDTDF